MTTYPTITRFGAPGNSAAKSAKEQLSRNENHYMLWHGFIPSLFYLFWDQDVGGSSPFTPTIFLKDISEMSLRNILNKQRMKGIEGER